MRFRARVDANHAEIVEELRRRGYGVLSLASVGKGVPDLCVSIPGGPLCVLLEVKSNTGKLTPDQVRWHAAWTGEVYVVRNTAAALAAIEYATKFTGFRG